MSKSMQQCILNFKVGLTNDVELCLAYFLTPLQKISVFCTTLNIFKSSFIEQNCN